MNYRNYLLALMLLFGITTSSPFPIYNATGKTIIYYSEFGTHIDDANNIHISSDAKLISPGSKEIYHPKFGRGKEKLVKINAAESSGNIKKDMFNILYGDNTIWGGDDESLEVFKYNKLLPKDSNLIIVIENDLSDDPDPSGLKVESISEEEFNKRFATPAAGASVVSETKEAKEEKKEEPKK